VNLKKIIAIFIYFSVYFKVTLKKENGSFGLVLRGGHDENPGRQRPFTVVHVAPNGSTFLEGTIRLSFVLWCLMQKLLYFSLSEERTKATPHSVLIGF